MTSRNQGFEHPEPWSQLVRVTRTLANSFSPNTHNAPRDPPHLHKDQESHVVVLSVNYQIAQKLHACTEVPAEGSNQRVHDIYDILLLASTVENEGLVQTRAACEDTFTHRAKHAWPPTVPAWGDWEQLWDALDIPDDARYTYADARQRFEQLLRQVAEA